jgi:tol-pal system protein YbgF
MKKWLSLTAYCLLLLSGCATTSDLENLRSSVTNIQIEIMNQKKEIAQIKASVTEMSKDINQTKASFSEISRDVSSLREYSLAAMREGQTNLLAQTTAISKELQMLKGRFDENRYFMDKTIKDLLSEREVQHAKITSLENELKEIKAKIANPPADKKDTSTSQESQKEASAQAPETKAAATADVNDPQKLYDDAHIDFKEKRYAQARQKFEKFTKDFPKHTLAPNSYFWLGESYYADKKYEDAILAYEAFLKKYPVHEKTRGAMLKQAYSFVEMGDKKTGKVLLEKVMERYPNSREAELAEKKIAEMLSKNTGSQGSAKKKKK